MNAQIEAATRAVEAAHAALTVASQAGVPAPALSCPHRAAVAPSRSEDEGNLVNTCPCGCECGQPGCEECTACECAHHTDRAAEGARDDMVNAVGGVVLARRAEMWQARAWLGVAVLDATTPGWWRELDDLAAEPDDSEVARAVAFDTEWDTAGLATRAAVEIPPGMLADEALGVAVSELGGDVVAPVWRTAIAARVAEFTSSV